MKHHFQVKNKTAIKAGKFAEGFFVGAGIKAIVDLYKVGAPYFQGNKIPGTDPVFPPFGLGVDDVTIAAGVPILYVVGADAKIEALGSFLGWLAAKGAESFGASINPVTVYGASSIQLSPLSGVAYPTIPKGVTVPPKSFYTQPRQPGTQAGATAGPKNFF